MKLSQHDLQQLDDDALRRLPEEALRTLSSTLLADLKDARERLQQNPTNSPQLPLTNNTAERAPRPWVIARRISHGTRTAVGSRAFTLLASVIDTCGQPGHSPWTHLAAPIADRRVGRPLAPLPQPGV